MTQVDIPTAAVFKPLLVPARYKGAYGGRASSKSHFFAGEVIRLSIRYPGLRVACLREVQRSLKFSSKLVVEDKLESLNERYPGLIHKFNILDREIRTDTDGLIIFQGMSDQTAESMKSLEGFDVFWFEEAQAMSVSSLEKLRPTARPTPRSRMNPEMWFSWNPRFKTDAVDELLRGDNMPPDSVVVQANFSDNPWFPKVLKEEMEWDRKRDLEKYNHIWMGGYLTRSDARVFSNWTEQEFDTPSDVVFHLGADWGFSVDPTVLVRCFTDEASKKLYVDRECYKVGCEIDDTPALFDSLDPTRGKMARAWTIAADSARPETISYMRSNGYPKIIKAKKGPGSVVEGVEFLKTYDIVVHPRCRHTIDELTMYSYKVDKHTEQVLPILEDKKNHVIDALRYAVEQIRYKVIGDTSSTVGAVAQSYDGGVAWEGDVDEGNIAAYYDGALT